MKFLRLTLAVVSATAFALVMPAVAEIVYTPLHISIPVGDSYAMDVNHDGVADFTLRSSLLEDYCQFGDGYVWTLSVNPASRNSLVTAGGHVGPVYAAALPQNAPVNSSQSLYPSLSIMAQLSWGFCGTGVLGEWLNRPDGYLGMQFRGTDNEIHYGWAKVSTVAYVDQWNVLHASTVLTGFAYETVPGQEILTGRTS